MRCTGQFHSWSFMQSRRQSKSDLRGPDGWDHGRKAISDELVSVINDGLYFYEQVCGSSRQQE